MANKRKELYGEAKNSKEATYDFLADNGLYKGSFSEFSAAVDNPDGRQAIWKFMNDNGLYKNDYNTFDEAMNTASEKRRYSVNTNYGTKYFDNKEQADQYAKQHYNGNKIAQDKAQEASEATNVQPTGGYSQTAKDNASLNMVPVGGRDFSIQPMDLPDFNAKNVGTQLMGKKNDLLQNSMNVNGAPLNRADMAYQMDDKGNVTPEWTENVDKPVDTGFNEYGQFVGQEGSTYRDVQEQRQSAEDTRQRQNAQMLEEAKNERDSIQSEIDSINASLNNDTTSSIYSEDIESLQGIANNAELAKKKNLLEERKKELNQKIYTLSKDDRENLKYNLSNIEDVIDAHDKEMMRKSANATVNHLSAGRSQYGQVGQAMSDNIGKRKEVEAKQKESAYYSNAKYHVREARRLVEAAEKNANGQEGFFTGAFNGFTDAVLNERTWDMGMQDMADYILRYKTTQKYDNPDKPETEGKGEAMQTFAKIKKGEKITDAEDLFLRSWLVHEAAQGLFGDMTSLGYKSGMITGEALPFMLEMYLNPLSAGGKTAASSAGRALSVFTKANTARNIADKMIRLTYAGNKLAGKKGAANVAKRMAENALGVAARRTMQVGDAVVRSTGMALTTGLPRVVGGTVADMGGELQSGYDNDGNIRFAGTKDEVGFWQSLLNNTASVAKENLTEMGVGPVGEAFRAGKYIVGGLGGKALGKTVSNALQKTGGYAAVKKYLDKVTPTAFTHNVNHFLQKTQWHGTLGEYWEEVEGNVLEAIFSDNMNFDLYGEDGSLGTAKNSVFNIDQNIETFVGVALMGGVTSAFATAGYRSTKSVAQEKMSDAIAEGERLFGADWKNIKRQIDSIDPGRKNENGVSYLTEFIIAKMKNGTISTKERQKAVFDYIHAIEFAQGVDMGDASLNKEAEKVEQQAKQETVAQESQEEKPAEEKREIAMSLQEAKDILLALPKGQEALDMYEKFNNDELPAGEWSNYINSLPDDVLNALTAYSHADIANEAVDKNVEVQGNAEAEKVVNEHSPYADADGNYTVATIGGEQWYVTSNNNGIITAKRTVDGKEETQMFADGAIDKDEEGNQLIEVHNVDQVADEARQAKEAEVAARNEHQKLHNVNTPMQSDLDKAIKDKTEVEVTINGEYGNYIVVGTNSLPNGDRTYTFVPSADMAGDTPKLDNNVVLPYSEFARQNDEFFDAAYPRQQEEAPVEEQPVRVEAKQEQPAEEPKEEQPTSTVKIDKNGEPDFSKATPEDIADYFSNEDDNLASQVIDYNIEQAKKAVDKSGKGEPKYNGGSIADYKKKVDEFNASKKAAEDNLQRWNDAKAKYQSLRADNAQYDQKAEEFNNEKKTLDERDNALGEAQTLQEFVERAVFNQRYMWTDKGPIKGLASHIGGKGGERSALLRYLSKDGVSPEGAAHSIAQQAREAGFPNVDEADVLNMINDTFLNYGNRTKVIEFYEGVRQQEENYAEAQKGFEEAMQQALNLDEDLIEDIVDVENDPLSGSYTLEDLERLAYEFDESNAEQGTNAEVAEQPEQPAAQGDAPVGSEEPEDNNPGTPGSSENGGTQADSSESGTDVPEGEPVEDTFKVSATSADKGGNFFEDKDGNIDLVQIPHDVFVAIGVNDAPLRITETMAKHILSRHGNEIGINTLSEAVEFVVDVMTNFDHVRQGSDMFSYIFSIENGRNKTSRRAITIIISDTNGEYVGVKTSGYERMDSLNKRPLLWEKGVNNTSATAATTANVTSELPQNSGEENTNASNQSNGSDGKDNVSASNEQEKEQENVTVKQENVPEEPKNETPSENEGNAAFTISDAQYTTQRGKVLDMKLVKFSAELSKEQYKSLLLFAKENKGWYDKEQGGFLMRNEETARELGNMLGGVEDKTPKNEEPAQQPAVPAGKTETKSEFNVGDKVTYNNQEFEVVEVNKDGSLNLHAEINFMDVNPMGINPKDVTKAGSDEEFKSKVEKYKKDYIAQFKKLPKVPTAKQLQSAIDEREAYIDKLKAKVEGNNGATRTDMENLAKCMGEIEVLEDIKQGKITLNEEQKAPKHAAYDIVPDTGDKNAIVLKPVENSPKLIKGMKWNNAPYSLDTYQKKHHDAFIEIDGVKYGVTKSQLDSVKYLLDTFGSAEAVWNQIELGNIRPGIEEQAILVNFLDKTHNEPQQIDTHGFKVGDKVIYKGKEATIHDFNNDGTPSLDTGLAPVIYVVANWEDISRVGDKEETPLERTLTADEIDASNADETLKTLAKSYLQGDTNMLAVVAYNQILNDIKAETKQEKEAEKASPEKNEDKYVPGYTYGSGDNMLSILVRNNTPQGTTYMVQATLNGKTETKSSVGESYIKGVIRKINEANKPAEEQKPKTERKPRTAKPKAEKPASNVDDEINSLLDEIKSDWAEGGKPDDNMYMSVIPGLTPKRMAAIAKILPKLFKVGGLLIEKGITDFKEWSAKMREMFMPIMKEDVGVDWVNQTIKSAWDAPYKKDGKVKKVSEWAAEAEKKSVSSPKPVMGDLFANVNNDNNEETNIQPGTSQGGTAGQQSDTNGALGGSTADAAQPVNGGRVDRGNGSHSTNDETGNRGVAGTDAGEREHEVSVKKNQNNNHAERGVDYAPKSPQARYNANIAAIKLMQDIMAEGRGATKQEMEVLRQFSGWGGLGGFINNNEKELRSLIGDDGYSSAAMSVNSAYFTPANVVDALWDVAKNLGFKGGKILEGSAGIGNILGLMPKSMSDRSDIEAVEIDDISGNILSLLYPDAKVNIKGFEATKVDNNSVDLAITNVPFVTGLHVRDTEGDKDLSKKFANIHDFCIAKNIRKLKQGGLGIFITSSGTLDRSKSLREWIVSDGNADVIGAFRLNNETFGGTNATSDIIIVRKRVNGVVDPNAIDVLGVGSERTATVEETDKSGKTSTREVPVVYNQYFIEHPENMGGEMAINAEKGETFHATSIGLHPANGINQLERLTAWIDSFKGHKQTQVVDEVAEAAKANEVLGPGVREGSVIVDKDGNICVARRGVAVPLEGKTMKNKVKGTTKAECLNRYNAIKKALADVLDYQTKNDDDAGLKPLLKKLNTAYDSFVRTYGNFTKNSAISFLRNDVDYANILALETVKETPQQDGTTKVEISKAGVFGGRVVSKEVDPEPKNIRDAITASLYMNGDINVDYIANALGKTADEVRTMALESGLAFENPSNGNIEVSYQYLSGNVREKLALAKESNIDGRYDENIKALEKAIPMDIPSHLIEFSIGSSWIDPALYKKYIEEKTGKNVSCALVAGTWNLAGDLERGNENRLFGVESNVLNKVIWGTELIQAAMRNVTIKVQTTKKHYDGSTETIVDKEATEKCSNKIAEIRSDFKEWARDYLRKNPEFAKEIERTYNDQFNNYAPLVIPEEFAPEHFGGAVTEMNGNAFQLYPHQRKAVVKATTQNTLFAHEVGTGKTFTLITTAMEMRRIGTAKKPMIVVQNATVGQFVASAKQLYPNAKVLTITESDMNVSGRKNFFAKIKYNDWDMIVIPQSVLDKIPDSEERQIKRIQEKIEEKLEIINQLADSRENSRQKKSIEKEIANAQEEIRNLVESISEKKKAKDQKKIEKARQNASVKAQEMLDRDVDDVENFDDMGIDALLIDEAHEYKHLGFETAMGGRNSKIKGIDPSFSKKSNGLFLKCQAVMEKSNGKNIVFATGTPISNTAAEIWTFMKYLMPKEQMIEYGIYYFDDFVRNFGNIVQMPEFTTSQSFIEVTRFAGYVNVPELVRIWSGVADTVKEPADVEAKKPDTIEGGKKPTMVFLPQTKSLRSIMASVREELRRFENMDGKEKAENSHIPLVMYGIASAASIDTRLVWENAPDEPGSKTNVCVKDVLSILEETKGYNGTVAIFADKYQNKRTGFNLYEEVKRKLVASGVPADQIFIMISGMSTKVKEETFAKVNRGEIRVILGSTQTLGTGVNIQERLAAIANLDVPNRPMDYTQRLGRLLRQGNMHKAWDIPVRILNYGVEDSLDVTGYQRLKTKGAIADSIMNGASTMDNNQEGRILEEEEDVFGDVVANLSGSEFALKKQIAEKEVRKYESKKANWESDQAYINTTIPLTESRIAQEKEWRNEAKEYADKLAKIAPDGKVSEIKVGNKTFTNIDEMADFIKEVNKKQLENMDKVRENADRYRRSSQADSSLSVFVNGMEFVFDTHFAADIDWNPSKNAFAPVASKSMYITCKELGIDGIPVYQGLIRNGLEYVRDEIIPGTEYARRVNVAESEIERMSKELEVLKSREGKPFEFQDKLDEARAKFEEYSEAMKAEMAAKEAKYAEEDAQVDRVSLDDLNTDTGENDVEEDNMQKSNMYIPSNYRNSELNDYDKEVLSGYVDNVVNYLPHHAPTYSIFSEDDIIEMCEYYNLSDNIRDVFVKVFNDPNIAGSYFDALGAIIVFPGKVSRKDVIEAIVIHEQLHYATYYFGEEMVKDDLLYTLEYVNKQYPDLYDIIRNNYKENEYHLEAIAYLMYKISIIKGYDNVFFYNFADDRINNFVRRLSFAFYGREKSEINRCRNYKASYREQYSKQEVPRGNRQFGEGRQTLQGGLVASESNDIRQRPGTSSVVHTPEDIEAISKAVNEAAAQFRTPVIVCNSEEDIDALNLSDNEKNILKKSKGLYFNGSVYVVSNNNDDANDAVVTVLHEVVGHKGLRQLVGESEYKRFLASLYVSLPKEERSKVNAAALRDFGGDVYAALDERLAQQAEKNVTPSWWNRVVAAVRQLLRKIGLDIKLNDNDVLYILWQSKNKLQKGDIISEARQKAMRSKLGINRKNNKPKPTPPTGGDGGGSSKSKKKKSAQTDPTQYDPIKRAEQIAALMKKRNLTEATANKNDVSEGVEDAKNARNAAMNAIIADSKSISSKIQKAMTLRRKYDQFTVDSIVGFVKDLIKEGKFEEATSREIMQILSAVDAANGKEDIYRELTKVVDVLTKHQLKKIGRELAKLAHVKDINVDDSGVVVQGKLGIRGQNILRSFRQNVGLKEELYDQLIEERNTKLSDTEDESLKEQYNDELIGLELAKQYTQTILDSQNEEKQLREEIKAAKEEYDAGHISHDAYLKTKAAIEDAIRDNNLDRLDAMADMFANLQVTIEVGVMEANSFLQKKIDRANMVRHFANSDLNGISKSPHRKKDEGIKSQFVNNTFVQLFTSPLATFEVMLRRFGDKAARGEGYLFEHFMRGWVDCRDNEIRNFKNGCKHLDSKVAEIFGMSGMKWSDLYDKEQKLPGVTVSFYDGSGQKVTRTLTQGNAIYIYMVNKMLDGQMKLRKMGIFDEDVEAMTKLLDPRLIKLADWVQEEFMVDLRNRYNEVHKRMFGASMKAIENYIPLRINKDAIKKESDITTIGMDGVLPSTKTGAIIKRTRNTLPLDVLNTDGFDVVLEHMQEMEHWAAFAELTRDFNTLISYNTFKNRVKNMATGMGAGETLWNKFETQGKIAFGAYNAQGTKRDDVDKLIVNVAKGVTISKISLRLFTAIKQILSFPAAMVEANIHHFIKDAVYPYPAFMWCYENLPIFQERWDCRFSGETRLMPNDSDWKRWQRGTVKLAARYGMSPNAFVDAVTCAIVAHSKYVTVKEYYKNIGFSEEEAEKRAKQDASIVFNQSQQSSESAFVNKMQVDKTLGSVVATMFRNSSMSYTRKVYSAMHGLRKRITDGDNVEFGKKKYIRMGFAPEVAEAAAKSDSKRANYRNLADVATFGFVMQFLWNVSPNLLYLLLGDDDDDKIDMLVEAAKKATVGTVEGLTFGNFLSNVFDAGVNSKDDSDFAQRMVNNSLPELPAVSDLEDVMSVMAYDNIQGWYELANWTAASGIGADPQVISDAIYAIADATNGDVEMSKEIVIALARMAQFPTSNTDRLYFEAMKDKDGKIDPKKLREYANNYVEYSNNKLFPVGNKIFYSGEIKEKRLERLRKQYDKKLKRYAGEDVANVNRWVNNFEKDYPNVLNYLESDDIINLVMLNEERRDINEKLENISKLQWQDEAAAQQYQSDHRAEIERKKTIDGYLGGVSKMCKSGQYNKMDMDAALDNIRTFIQNAK